MNVLVEVLLGWAINHFLSYVDEKWQDSRIRDKAKQIVEKYEKVQGMTKDRKLDYSINELIGSTVFDNKQLDSKTAKEIIERAIQRFLKSNDDE
jgi:hypothetical protein